MASLNVGVVVDRSGADHATHTEGGKSPERVAADLLGALEQLGAEPRVIDAGENLDLDLRHARPDVCLLATCGPVSGRGVITAALERHGVPFAGPNAAATSLAFDKVRARQLLAFHNLPVPASVALEPGRTPHARSVSLLGWPCVVKPRRGSLGAGVTRVQSVEDVPRAMESALLVDDQLVVERHVAGDEVQVVLDGERVVGMMHQTRHADGALESVCPPDLARGQIDGIANLARRAVTALGVDRGVTRVDVLVSPRHNEVILEVEPLPPMHRDSTVARVFASRGIEYAEFVALRLREALGRERTTHSGASASTWVQ